ncbi:MAG: hypothetical protein GWP03_05420 [Proteobacteria bacterium]|nr:hypothetical protein [Pseudomonadota bacterium]
MKLILEYPVEKEHEVENIKNILMESTNATLSIEKKGENLLFEIHFYKTEEMHRIFELMKNAGIFPARIVPAKFINRIFPSKEEKEARKFFKNGK